MTSKAMIKTPEKFFYFLGFALTVTELLFNISGSSLCHTEGCKVVESFVRGGEVVLLLGGVVLFGFLLLLSIKKKFPLFHSIILITAISVEGYLLGFQSFIVKEFCLFCIAVFTILFISAIIRLVQGRKEMAFAFLSFVSVFFITYLVNPQINEFPSSKYVLIYSKNCPQCKEVIQYCKQMSIPVHALEAKDVGTTLKALKINSVPVLFCNEGMERKFIIGVDNIKEYLFAKVVPKQETGEVCPIFSPSECK
ncbi:MAG: hypothetical protein N3A00_03380 [Thermodesulfovibrio sp.]|nr:hypothetical protein [Thermodesulfovibrio sp.]